MWNIPIGKFVSIHPRVPIHLRVPIHPVLRELYSSEQKKVFSFERANYLIYFLLNLAQ